MDGKFRFLDPGTDDAPARENAHWVTSVERAFFPVAILGATIALYVVSVVSDTPTVLKGSYGLLGLVIAAGVYYTSETGTRFSMPVDSTRVGKLTTILIVATIPVTLWTGSRLLAVLVFVPLGYLLFWLQVGSASPLSLLVQLTGLYLVSPVTKVLTSGLYYENGDVFDHVRYVDLLVSSERIATIPRYDAYPGYHLLAGTVSTIAEVSPYHAMVVMQFVLFAAMIPALYLLARTVFEDRHLAVLSAFALTVTYAASRYVTVYFPESVEVVLVVFVLFVSFRMRLATGQTRWGLAVIAGIVGVTAIFTHHLTVLIYLVFVGIVLLGRVLLHHVRHLDRLGPHSSPLVFLGVVSVGYWLYEREFLMELVYFVNRIFVRSLTSSGDGWRMTVSLGRTLPPLTPRVAARSLGSPEGIYFVLLVAVVALGIVELLGARQRYQRALHLIVVGVLTTPLLLRTPIFPDFSRIRFPLAVFFAFLLVPSLDRLSRTEFSTTARRVVPVLLVIALATTGVLVASDDLYGLNAGPDLYELQPLPEPQVDYSQAELQELRATSGFVSEHGERVSTLTMTGRSLGMFGVEYDEPRVVDGTLYPEDDLFVYREAWTDHRVSFTRDDLVATLVLSETWLDRAVAAENKVYTAGGTGILWDPRNDSIGASVGETSRNITNPT